MPYDPSNPTVNPYANMPGLLGNAQSGPYVDPRQAGYGGAAQALSPMMGPQNRQYGMGQVLAAAGGGLAQGMQGAQQQNISMQQVQQQMQDAELARQDADRTRKFYQTAGPGGEFITPEALKFQQERDLANSKYGTPQTVADPNSSTGYSLQQTNQDGDTRTVGEAKPPTSMYDPDAPMRTVQAKAALARYETASKNIDVADETLANIEQMASLVDRVDSGSFAETKLDFLKSAKALGIDVDATTIADSETMKSKGMDFILQKISQTKGAVSEKEMSAFEAASAGIKNTPEGNRMILDLGRKVAERVRFESEAVRQAYKPGMSIKELDDIKLKARAEFGSVVPERQAPAMSQPAGTIGSQLNPNVDALVGKWG